MIKNQFKVGETWVDRTGKKYTIIAFTSDTEYPILALDHRKVFHKFTQNGNSVRSDLKSERDLIKVI